MISLLVASVALLPQKAAPLTPQLKKQIVASIGTTLRTMAFVPGKDFSNWSEIVRDYKDALDDAKKPAEFVSAVNEALADYGVSHLTLVAPTPNTSGKIRSFGFVSTVYEGKTIVTRVFSDTQADRIGLHRGMELTTFDFPDYPDTDRIEVGYRDPSGRFRTYTIEKETFVPTFKPDLVWGDQTTCVLTVPSFSGDYDTKLVEQLIRNAARFPNLLIDLRGNPGGSPEYTMHLLGAFLPAGTRVGAAVSKEMIRDFKRATGKSAVDRTALVRWAPKLHAMEVAKLPVRYKGHIAVLIDGNSGSGAELAAQALRDYAKAPIFGRPSAGAVLFANAAPLPGGYMLGFPWRDYWTAKGERIEGRPIQPDVMADDGPEAVGIEPFPLRRRAIDWLNAKYPSEATSK